MQFRPPFDQPSHSRGQVALQYVHGTDCNNCPMFVLPDVEMGWIVFVEVHANDNSKEAADLRRIGSLRCGGCWSLMGEPLTSLAKTLAKAGRTGIYKGACPLVPIWGINKGFSPCS